MVAIRWAAPTDVGRADLEHSVDGADEQAVAYWLGVARRAITTRVPDLLQRIESGRVDPESPADVQIELVLGKLSNPSGIRTVQEANGPTSGSVTYGGESPGQMVLSAAQVALLGGSGRGRRAAVTVPTW